MQRQTVDEKPKGDDDNDDDNRGEDDWTRADAGRRRCEESFNSAQPRIRRARFRLNSAQVAPLIKIPSKPHQIYIFGNSKYQHNAGDAFFSGDDSGFGSGSGCSVVFSNSDNV
ncbi:hypothetical protein ACLOJK_008508 [Asimina triloba]